MMKFSVEKVLSSCNGRLGTIFQACCHSQENFIMETPMCTLFTKGASAPHLSMDMLRRVNEVPSLAAVSIGSLADHHENIASFGKGLAEFSSMKNKLIFTTLHDASTAVVSGKNDRTGVAVWGKGGKFKLDPQLYIKVQEAFAPDWFQALSDGDTDKDCAVKRVTKAVSRTLDFLDDIVEMKEKSQVLKNSSLIGVIEGGFNKEERKRSALETAHRPVDGFLIEGFQKGHREEDLFNLDNFQPVLAHTVEHLPLDKPRIMENAWSPLQVIKAFKMGIDVFSSAYPHILTEKGCALVADYKLPPTTQAAQLEVQASNPDSEPIGFFINLKDKMFVEKFTPILPGCACYACANFTCSYIHHLLNTSELLAFVLLTIHNFHQYFDFFVHLRRAVREDKLAELEESLSAQLDTNTKTER